MTSLCAAPLSGKAIVCSLTFTEKGWNGTFFVGQT
nr:MAG TPA: hypothetical protein [Caudoviricetes sp.]